MSFKINLVEEKRPNTVSFENMEYNVPYRNDGPGWAGFIAVRFKHVPQPIAFDTKERSQWNSPCGGSTAAGFYKVPGDSITFEA